MTDNIYYVDDLVGDGNTRILSDDGTGTDWLVLRRSHDSNAISLCWWSVHGVSTEGESIFFDDDVASRLIVRGLIENARGANGDDWIRGNEIGNILYGDMTALDTLVGGDDTLDGAEGNDTIYGGYGADEIDGGTGDDLLFGNQGLDTIRGGLGRDTIDGGAGADVLSGGADAGDLLSYAQSSAAVHVSLTFGATTFASGGDAEGDQLDGFFNITGSAYNDVLTDTISTTLALNANANWFDGGTGHDVLSMGGGNDTALGGRGNDTIYGGDGNDSLNAGIGRDVVLGGNGSDTLIGGLGTDLLSGGNGNDRIDGGDGNDTLSGDAGSDVLISFLGTDRMTGGAGADRFVFVNVYDSSAGAGFDTITDFKHSEGDRIDISGIDANYDATGDAAFTFLGTAAFTGAGAELRVEATATGWSVQGDLDGDGTADFILTLIGTTLPAPVAGDFVL